MTIKRLTLLASAVLALVAFMAPAGASALEIKDVNGEAAAGQEVTGTAHAQFASMGTGITCNNIHVAGTVNPQDVSITKFEITTTECTSFGILYLNCQIDTDTPTGIDPTDTPPGTTALSHTAPWTAILGSDATGPKLTLGNPAAGPPTTAGMIDGTLKSIPPKNCFTNQNDITLTDVTLRALKSASPVETGNPIRGFEISGTVKVHTALGVSTFAASGTITLVGNSGTFKIE